MSVNLAVKLGLLPALVGAVSLAGRRWGPAVMGWLVALPLISGPVILLLAMEQGNAFASRAAQGTILGLVSFAAFCLVYSWASFRTGWFGSLLASWSAYFLLTLALERVVVPLAFLFPGVAACLVLILRLLPESRAHAALVNPPPWEIPLRMLAASAIAVALTAAARSLGPRLSGLLTPFPVVAPILAAFTHHFQGAAATARLLRGLVTGLFTFAVFFLVVAGGIEKWGLAAAFGLASLVGLLVHGFLLWRLREHIGTS